MVVFIVVPKNSGLQTYKEKGLSCLDNVDISKIIEVRGEDVPSWVEQFQEHGKNALGLTGEDLFKEFLLGKRNRKIEVVKKIAWDDKKAKYGKPALCLLGPQDFELKNLPKKLTVCIAAKYKNLGRKYLNFLEQKGYTFKKIYVNGCVEVSCKEGIADLVVDIVYTGSTLERFGLKVYEVINESDFVIIGAAKKKSIIFDMDGVLIDTSKSYGVAAQRTASCFLGKDVPIASLQKIKELGINNEWECCREFLRKAGKDVAYADIVKKFQSIISDGLANEESVVVRKETLRKLESEFSLGIVTGRPGGEAFSTLKKFGLNDFFDVVITRDDLAEDQQKPKPDGLLIAQKKLQAEEVIYVGDMPADALMSQFGGFRFIGVSSPGYSREFTKNLVGAECILDDINEIVEFLGIKK